MKSDLNSWTGDHSHPGTQNIPNASSLRPSHAAPSRHVNLKAAQFRQKIIAKIGEPLFKKIYDFVSATKRCGPGGKNVDSSDPKIRLRKFRKKEHARRF